MTSSTCPPLNYHDLASTRSVLSKVPASPGLGADSSIGHQERLQRPTSKKADMWMVL